MATSRRAWQRAEQSAAALFGAARRVLSGSANRGDIDGDDSTHPRLWIESKLRANWNVYTLWHAVRIKAIKARKTPVLVLREKGKHGALVVVHEGDDLNEMVIEYLVALDDMDLLGIEAVVRTRRAGDGREG